MKKTDLFDVVGRKLSPFMLLFGLYLITHGHLSPGGGFQGGVVLASAVILLLLCKGTREVARLLTPAGLSMVEILAFCSFLMVGILGIFLTGHFLGNFIPRFFTAHTSVAWKMLILNIIIGVKVGAGISLVCFYLFRED